MSGDQQWIIGQGIGLVLAGFGAYLSIRDRLTKLESQDLKELPTRVARIETVLILISKKAADMLHSPTDHFRLDKLVEKYKDDHYDLTDAEWKEMFNLCDEVQKDSKNPMDAKLAAMLLGILGELGKDLAEHKMMRYKVENERKPKNET